MGIGVQPYNMWDKQPLNKWALRHISGREFQKREALQFKALVPLVVGLEVGPLMSKSEECERGVKGYAL